MVSKPTKQVRTEQTQKRNVTVAWHTFAAKGYETEGRAVAVAAGQQRQPRLPAGPLRAVQARSVQPTADSGGPFGPLPIEHWQCDGLIRRLCLRLQTECPLCFKKSCQNNDVTPANVKYRQRIRLRCWFHSPVLETGWNCTELCTMNKTWYNQQRWCRNTL